MKLINEVKLDDKVQQVLFYYAVHGLKNEDLISVNDMISNTIDKSNILLAQIHLATVLSSTEHAILLKTDKIRKVLVRDTSLFHPLLMHSYCHCQSNGIIGGPDTITHVLCYDMGCHRFKNVSTYGSAAITGNNNNNTYFKMLN